MIRNKIQTFPPAKYCRAGILPKTRKTIDKFHMLEYGDKVLVAFSAGPDSSALLCLLNELKRRYGISLCAGHINHMLRGEESLEDEKIAKKICRQMKIPSKVVRRNIKKLKRKGESIEEAARRVRYETLENMAKSFGANKIATGHNKNDQVETILFRIIRGAGEKGLGGIPHDRILSCGIKIIRPLIEIERKDIEEYLKSKKIKPRIDSSNLDTKFLRNRIRHELIPYLEKYNPQIKESLIRISQISTESNEYIRENTHKILKKISTEFPGVVRIDLNKLLLYPIFLRGPILREVFKKFKKDFKDLSYSNLKEIEKIINSKKANLVLRLSPKIEVVKEYTALFIKNVKSSKNRNCGNYSYIFKRPGKFRIPEIEKTIHIDFLKKKDRDSIRFDDSSVIFFDADKIKFPLILKTRKKGDKFCSFGMKGEKKLKDFFIDEKVPLKERDRIPILATEDDKILWIAGYRRSSLGIITKYTTKIGKVRLE